MMDPDTRTRDQLISALKDLQGENELLAARLKNDLEADLLFEGLAGQIHELLLVHDAAGKILRTNPQAEELGYSRQEFAGMHINEILKEVRFSEGSINGQFLQAGAQRVMEVEVIKKDGSFLRANLSWRCTKNENSMLYMLLLEEKILTVKVAEHKGLMRMAGEKARLGGWSVDLENNKLYWSDEIARIHETPVGHVPEISEAINFYTPEWREKILKVFSSCVEEGLAYDEEMEIRTAKGNRLWVRTIGEPIRNENDKIVGVHGAFQDISDRKKLETRLRENEFLLSKAQEIANLGSWSLDLKENNLIWSDQMFKITGIEKEGFNGNYQAFLEVVHPEDREKVDEIYTTSVKESAPGYEIVHRIIHRVTGETRYLLEKCQHIKDRYGEIISSIGMTHDITEQKHAAEALKSIGEEKTNLLNRYEEAQCTAKIGSWEWDLSSQEVWWSKQLYDIFDLIPGQYAPSLEGNALYVHPEDRDSYHQAAFKSIEEKTELNYDLRIISEKGVMKHCNSRARVDYGADGKATRMYGTFSDITGRKKAELEVLKSKKELEDFFENDISADYVSSVNGEILSYNKTFLEFFGLDKIPEGKGITITSFYKRPEDRRLLLQDVEKFKKVKNRELEFFIEGQEKYALVNAIGIFEEGELKKVRGYIVDITAQKNAEEELTKLSVAVEQNPVAMIITDREARITYVNPQTTRLTGYTFDELLGENPRIFNSGENSKALYADLWKTISSGRVWQGELRNKKKNDELYWEHITISPIRNSKGRTTSYIAVKEDVTRLKELTDDLLVAKERAEESDRLKTAFLTNVSHEIRTPMNGILGFAELLRDPLIAGEQQQHYLRMIEESGERMLNIINDIIDISKIESGELKTLISEVNINRTLEFACSFFEPEVQKKGLRLSCHFASRGEDICIMTDGEKFNAIVLNLLKNAVKYTDHGEIEIGFSLEGDMVKCYVKDTGIGVAPDKREAIFDRFVQAEIVDKKARQGAGLGLSICKAYVTLLGGNIWVAPNAAGDSVENEGSTFYFTLPYEVPQSTEPAAEIFPDAEEPEDFPKLKILIAEDDRISSIIISNFIKDHCREILQARDGKAAVALALEHEDLDLILMDVQMPELNGHQATREIRKFNNEVVIIAQTAYTLADDAEKALAAGCDHYLSKPVRKQELIGLMQKCFGVSRK
ncbi:PAS domain S-box protein [Salinimicrobium oceani]|uniref:histidine kinase n=1 Tax=Salinimicrobium oceani TaxID=2722702 RepID=A0ABX1D1B1_9FLAO|nr:PAS domain S-box protein [Salinimicrobium oceani]NJW52463.1 PAS domain S-box protein [Salinimicrobium oceani]